MEFYNFHSIRVARYKSFTAAPTDNIATSLLIQTSMMLMLFRNGVRDVEEEAWSVNDYCPKYSAQWYMNA